MVYQPAAAASFNTFKAPSSCVGRHIEHSLIHYIVDFTCLNLNDPAVNLSSDLRGSFLVDKTRFNKC
jgi:hypothetical protein